MKKRYKSIVFVLVLVLILALIVGCGKDESDSDEVAGYYAIESMTVDGETFDADFLEEMEISYYIRLNDDNTAEINTDMLLTGTWKNGELHYTQDGEEYFNKYELKGDLLTIDASADGSEMVMVFKRED